VLVAFQEPDGQQEIQNFCFLSLKSYHPIHGRDSIPRPIAPISSAAGGDDTTKSTTI
jgi:hypothetical protein